MLYAIDKTDGWLYIRLKTGRDIGELLVLSLSLAEILWFWRRRVVVVEVVSTLDVVRNQPSLTSWRLCPANNKSVTLYVRLFLLLSLLLFFVYLIKQKCCWRVISIHYQMKYTKKKKKFLFCCWLINMDNFIGHARPASSVCFCFVLFSSSSFSPSVKGVPLPIRKSRMRCCCEDWTRLFNGKNKNNNNNPKSWCATP